MNASEKSEDELLGIDTPTVGSDEASKDEQKKMDTSTTEENMDGIEEELLGVDSLPSSGASQSSKVPEKRTTKTSESIEDIEEELLLLSSPSVKAKKKNVTESSKDESMVEPSNDNKHDTSKSLNREHLISTDSVCAEEVKCDDNPKTDSEVSSNTPEKDKLQTERVDVETPRVESPKSEVESPKSEIEILDFENTSVEEKKKDIPSKIEKGKRQASFSSDIEVIDCEDNQMDNTKQTGTNSKHVFKVSNSQKSKPGIGPTDTVIEVIDDDDDDESLDDENELEILEDNSESDIYETDEMSEESNSFMDGKICIYSSQGSFLVWNAEDAQMLREECRIVGKLTGCLARAPRQNVHLGLPLQLMPEEAKLLTDIDAAVVVEETETSDKTWKTRERAFKAMREENCRIQQKLYKEERREEIRKRMGEIVAGKKAKKRKIQEAVVRETETKSESTEPLSKESKTEGSQGVMKRSPSLSKSDKAVVEEESSDEDQLTVDDIAVTETNVKHALVQVFTENPWRRSLEPANDFHFPASDRDYLRYAVFKDLWKKGYCLTSGVKFGGDFLVYPGDPSRFHSHFIAVCMDQHQEIPMLDVIAKGRLASNVRKSTILCSLSRKKKVIYTSLQWTGLA